MRRVKTMIIFPSLLVLAGCQFGLAPDTSSLEERALRLAGVFGASFEQQPVSAEMASDLGGARLRAAATAPAGETAVPYTLPTSGSTTYDAFTDYPEFGWTTTVTIETTGDAGVYRVSSVSEPDPTYDSYLIEDRVEEVYYVQDTNASDGTAGADGEYNYHDSIYDPTGGKWEALYRESLSVTFDDGSVRSERLVESSNAGGRTFALFPIDLNAADMDFPSADYEPETATANANTFSSVVVYTQQLDRDLNYWYDDGDVTPYIVGVRYYSELHDVIFGQYTATTYVLEVVMDGDAAAPDLTGDPMLANIVTRKVTTIDDTTFTASRHDARMKITLPDPGGSGSVEVEGSTSGYNRFLRRIFRRIQEYRSQRLVTSVLPPNFDSWTDVETVLGADLNTGPVTVLP